MNEPIDISKYVRGVEFPVCPLCNDAIENIDDYREVEADGAVAIAHAMCLRDRGLLP